MALFKLIKGHWFWQKSEAPMQLCASLVWHLFSGRSRAIDSFLNRCKRLVFADKIRVANYWII